MNNKDIFKSNINILKKEDKNTLIFMLQQIYLIREFENMLLRLQKENLIHGPIHSSIGQEAIGVGSMNAIRSTDFMVGTHRAHHEFLAKALSFYAPRNYNPLEQKFSAKMQDSVNRLLAEIIGLAPGFCGGRGGSMHLSNPKIGVVGTNAIVAGGIPIATGIAFSQKYLKKDNIVVSFMGEGAVNQGAFHEALNLAGLWKLPIIYIIENNLYSVATRLEETIPTKRVSKRASSYGMNSIVVDGNDLLAVKYIVEKVAKEIRNSGSPYLIESLTYRLLHHGGGLRGSAYGYRTQDEEDRWLKKDPFTTFQKLLFQENIISKNDNQKVMKTVNSVIKNAEDYCFNRDIYTKKLSIKDSLWPKTESLVIGVRSDQKEFENMEFVEAEDLILDKKVKYIEAIAAITSRWLQKDEEVFVIGEEVGHFKGGVYMATAGLPQKYPERLINTPISEAGFTGLSFGAAIVGLKPIIEIMFPDFVLVAADQIFNQIGKLRYIYGGNLSIPLVMRTQVSKGRGYGGQHSMDPVGLFALFPGWRIIAPSTPFDYIGLFNTAMVSQDPVLIVEHYNLYNTTDLIPTDNLDYFIEMGRSKKILEGKDLTVLSYSYMIPLLKKVASELNKIDKISLEVIDLRTLDLANIDYEMIGQSLKKTGRIAIIEQASQSMSLGSHISHKCMNLFFDYLDAPVLCLNSVDIPLPVSKVLESATLPSVNSITNDLRKFLNK
jgi:2-oxoisovalerate dehydrogenase E1 component